MKARQPAILSGCSAGGLSGVLFGLGVNVGGGGGFVGYGGSPGCLVGVSRAGKVGFSVGGGTSGGGESSASDGAPGWGVGTGVGVSSPPDWEGGEVGPQAMIISANTMIAPIRAGNLHLVMPSSLVMNLEASGG